MNTGSQDAEQLRLLSIFYYVWAGLTLGLTCLGGVWAMIGLGIATAAATGNGREEAAIIGGIGGFVLLIAFAFAAVVGGLSAWTGRCLATRRNHTFILVMAAISCLSFPLGTALGVFTFVVLLRPSVKALFEQAPAVTHSS